MALIEGNSGQAVTDLQQALQDAGYSPGPIDGIFGPLTAAAVNSYKTDNGLNPNGVAGSAVLSGLGLAEDSEGDEDGEYNNLPGGGEIWNVDGTAYVVYAVPGTEPPVLMAWEVSSDENLESYFGPDQDVVYDEEVTSDEFFNGIGAVVFGVDTELANFDDDPFASWSSIMEVEASIAPWILDEDYQTLIAMATLEGRALTDAEIQSTSWWQDHTQAEREWMKLWYGDREEADRRLQDNRILARDTLTAAGLTGWEGSGLAKFMADKVTTGVWSQTYFNNQVTAISDPESGIKLDDDLQAWTADIETTIAEEDQVKAMVDEWLGPALGNWDEAKIDKWAGILRNDPEGEQRLINRLQRQRLALFPQYEDKSLTYDDIADPWRTYAARVWGQPADEMDSLFLELIRNNDMTENGKLLRSEGLKRGVGKVISDAQADLFSTFGDSVREGVL